jgi:DNA-binding transcriptional ArsR family regulator
LSNPRRSADRKRRAEAASLFAALGDESRLRLVARLCADGPLSLSRLAADTDVTRQAVTKHLRVMEQAGLVRCTRRGRETIWEMEQRRVEEAQRYLQQISAQWDDALARLKAFVE